MDSYNHDRPAESSDKATGATGVTFDASFQSPPPSAQATSGAAKRPPPTVSPPDRTPPDRSSESTPSSSSSSGVSEVATGAGTLACPGTDADASSARAGDIDDDNNNSSMCDCDLCKNIPSTEEDLKIMVMAALLLNTKMELLESKLVNKLLEKEAIKERCESIRHVFDELFQLSLANAFICQGTLEDVADDVYNNFSIEDILEMAKTSPLKDIVDVREIEDDDNAAGSPSSSSIPKYVSMLRSLGSRSGRRSASGTSRRSRSRESNTPGTEGTGQSSANLAIEIEKERTARLLEEQQQRHEKELEQHEDKIRELEERLRRAGGQGGRPRESNIENIGYTLPCIRPSPSSVSFLDFSRLQSQIEKMSTDLLNGFDMQ